MSLLADYLRRRAERGEATDGVNVADSPSTRGADADGNVGERGVTPRRLALTAAVGLLGAAVVRRLRRGRG